VGEDELDDDEDDEEDDEDEEEDVDDSDNEADSEDCWGDGRLTPLLIILFLKFLN